MIALFVAIKEISKAVGLTYENIKGFPIKKNHTLFSFPVSQF